MNNTRRDAVAVDAHAVFTLLDLAVDLQQGCSFVDADGNRVREMDQLHALLIRTRELASGIADRVEALQ